jgi:hypothetical protein
MKFTNGKKILTLCSFVTLITAFVLYKAGVFDKYADAGVTFLQSSSNGGAMNNSRTDTMPIPKKDSTSHVDMTTQILKDSGDLKYLMTKRLDSFAPKKTVIMGSSKSGAIFKPDQRQNDLLRIIKLYQGDSVGLRKALERYF